MIQLTIGTGSRRFLYDGGAYTTIDVPGAFETEAYGINNADQIVGDYCAGGRADGFLLSGGSYTTLDVPGSIQTTDYGINDSGQIVGIWRDARGTFHGFLATPQGAIPEPSTLTLLRIGTFGVLGYCWRWKRSSRPSSVAAGSKT